MLKVTVLFEAHDPMAQDRIKKLEAERDAAERDASRTPSPIFGAMTDLAKVALTQAMSDPEKFQEFLKLFQNKRKPFDVSDFMSSLPKYGAAENSGPSEVPTPVPAPSAASGSSASGSSASGSSASDSIPKLADLPADLKIAEAWTRLDSSLLGSDLFVRETSALSIVPFQNFQKSPHPPSVVARVQRIGDLEASAELHAWSLVQGKPTDFGAAKTAVAAATLADKALRDAGWILLGDYGAFSSSREDADPPDDDPVLDADNDLHDLPHEPLRRAPRTRKSR